MPVDKSFRMKILESTDVLETEPRPRGVPRVNVRPSTVAIVRAFKQSEGYEDIVASIPKSATVAGWETGTQVAYFSVCNKNGSAQFLDIWDPDHFDFFTDMQRPVNTCRAWFSHRGFTTWGSGETATGRINCAFNAAVAGNYSCVAQLQSYPSTS